MKKRDKNKRPIKRRQIKIDRITSDGKCVECEKLYAFFLDENGAKKYEKKPAIARRFNKLIKSKKCLECLTKEKGIKAWEKMNLHVLHGEPL